MSLISESLKQQYATVMANAQATIHRHYQPSPAEELHRLSQQASDQDIRDSYGKGGLISDFEGQLAQLFNKPACVFLATGTLAQCAAMKCYSEQSERQGIGLHPTSHLLLHEHMAIEQLWQLKAVQIGRCSKVLTVADFEQLLPDQIAAVIVELPMREMGGQLPSWEELLEMRQWCDRHQIKLHLDGARIWQTSLYYQRTLAQISGLFDSVYVSFYKDLGGIFGAALLGTCELIDQARIWARRAGGNPITLYPEVLAAQTGLQHYLDKMPEYVAYTRRLCKLLCGVEATLVPESPEVSMFHLKFEMSAQALGTRVVNYAEKTGVVALPLPRAGNEHSCTVEIAIGDQATAQPPEFWAKHLKACLAN